MPDVIVHNNTSSTLNIAFSVTTPLWFHNSVNPDQTVHFPLSTFVHGFEARIDSGLNRFSSDESWKKIREIGTACAVGATAVTLGTGWLLGAFGRQGSPVGVAALAGAGATWNAANACWYFGFIYVGVLLISVLDTVGAQCSQSGEGAVCVCKVWIPFHDKHYSIRDLNGRFALWDDDGNHSIN